MLATLSVPHEGNIIKPSTTRTAAQRFEDVRRASSGLLMSRGHLWWHRDTSCLRVMVISLACPPERLSMSLEIVHPLAMAPLEWSSARR